MKFRAQRFGVATLGVLVVFASGCRRFRGGHAAPPPAPPPIERFKPGEWKNFKGATIAAPAATLRAWRVLMLQERPRPKKNPRWQAIASADSGFIQMPPGSTYRCLYNPVLIRAQSDEKMMEVDKWEVLRSVRCSSDGWNTYSQSLHRVTFAPDGQELGKSAEQTELYLHDRIGGYPTEITIVLRSD